MSTTPNQFESPAGFCQQCGTPLAAAEVRTVAGMLYCEPCLAQRLGIPRAAAGVPPGVVQPVEGATYPIPGGPMPYVPVRNSPVLAGLLGFIPGVGAMYNGQVAKGLVHVVVFIALVSAADHVALFGILIAFWVFYQVFDAYQTAQALQRGLPVPDHLGLNQIAAKFGFPHATGHQVPYPASYSGSYPNAAAGQPPTPPVYGGYAGYSAPVPPVPPMPPPVGTSMVVAAEYMPPPAPPVDFGQPPADMPPPPRSLPAGAIVLVALGVFFLLGTAGVLSTHWLSHGWPLILIALGVYIAVKNMNNGGPR